MCRNHRRKLSGWLIALGVVSVALPYAGHAEELTVSAAASLTNAFGEIARAFEEVHADVKITLNFAASDVLLKQIEQGAPADVFASADEATMDRAEAGKLIVAGSRRDFAANTLVLIAPSTGPLPTMLDALRGPAYEHVALGNPDSVPAGRYAKQVLIAAGHWDALQTKLVPAQNVRQVLDYVARGEAQAGFVYATDAALMPDKVRTALTLPTATPVRYPIALVERSAHAAQARVFVDFVLSDAAQATLHRYGFVRATP